MIRSFAAGAALALTLLPAAAQEDRTGTGGGPLTAEKAPNTTELGQTKPPSRAASPADGHGIPAPTRNDREQDAIMNGICTGCGSK